jgi:membrane-associated protease RseP (regulator of RpoE activity)
MKYGLVAKRSLQATLAAATEPFCDKQGMNDRHDPSAADSLVLRSSEPEVILAEAVDPLDYLPPPPRPRVWLPLLLFVATCLTTTMVGGLEGFLRAYSILSKIEASDVAVWQSIWAGLTSGLWFSVPLMTILICHELGHFFQARRYGVYCSYPHFIPVPLWPLGTMGAAIAMDPRVPNRKALFDIGISGPLAGLVPTIIFVIVGLHWSQPVPMVPGGTAFGVPLLFQWLAQWIVPVVPPGYIIAPHPMAFAGWAGLLLTTLNLFPIGQLDGGHVFYSLLGRRANRIVRVLFFVIVMMMIFYWSYLYSYTLLIVLLALMRPTHPPTADDRQPLGLGRSILGWLTLAFIPLGFTPTPFIAG